jgi:hypothetical protein
MSGEPQRQVLSTDGATIKASPAGAEAGTASDPTLTSGAQTVAIKGAPIGGRQPIKLPLAFFQAPAHQNWTVLAGCPPASQSGVVVSAGTPDVEPEGYARLETRPGDVAGSHGVGSKACAAAYKQLGAECARVLAAVCSSPANLGPVHNTNWIPVCVF